MSNIKGEMKTEMDQLRTEICRRPAQMMVYPAPLDDMVKLTFAGNKWENSMEFWSIAKNKWKKLVVILMKTRK